MGFYGSKNMKGILKLYSVIYLSQLFLMSQFQNLETLVFSLQMTVCMYFVML
jgi:hypothetical protein